MRKLIIVLGLAVAALIVSAAPGSAQAIYFGYGYGPAYYGPGYYGYYHRPHRYYARRYWRRHHRHYYYAYRPRYYGYSRYSGRWTSDLNEMYGCPYGWTVQSGRCKPYRGY